MFHRLVLLLGGLVLCSEGDSHGRSTQVVAFAGEAVILPCSLKISAGGDLPTVEWSKKDLQPDVVFLYRDGCETFEMKNLDFEFRTSLVMREMKNGNVSLRISNLKLSDSGEYRCLKILKNGSRETSEVELVVVAASGPKLSVVPHGVGGVTVECEARCWLPLPQVMILDDEGNDITAEEPKKEAELRGCFTVKQRVTLQNPTNRVVCRVHQLVVNHSRTAEIFIPDLWRRSDFVLWISVAATASLCSAVFIFICWSRSKCPKSVMRKVCSHLRPCETSVLLMQRGAASNTENGTVESLRLELDRVKAGNHQKDRTIKELRDEITSLQLRVACQLSQPAVDQNSSRTSSSGLNMETRKRPKSVSFPQKNAPKPKPQANPAYRRLQENHRNHSSPSLTAESPTSSLVRTTEVRVRSQTEPISGQNLVWAQQKRPAGISPSYNRFSPLADS